VLEEKIAGLEPTVVEVPPVVVIPPVVEVPPVVAEVPVVVPIEPMVPIIVEAPAQKKIQGESGTAVVWHAHARLISSECLV